MNLFSKSSRILILACVVASTLVACGGGSSSSGGRTEGSGGEGSSTGGSGGQGEGSGEGGNTTNGGTTNGSTGGTTTGGTGGTTAGGATTASGLALNGTPNFATSACSTTLALTPSGGQYTGCASGAVAIFSGLSVVDAQTSQICTASFNNGALTVSNASLSVSAAMNSEINSDNVTTDTTGTVTLASISAKDSNSLVGTSTATLTWTKAGQLSAISGSILNTAGQTQSFSCRL